MTGLGKAPGCDKIEQSGPFDSRRPDREVYIEPRNMGKGTKQSSEDLRVVTSDVYSEKKHRRADRRAEQGSVFDA